MIRLKASRVPIPEHTKKEGPNLSTTESAACMAVDTQVRTSVEDRAWAHSQGEDMTLARAYILKSLKAFFLAWEGDSPFLEVSWTLLEGIRTADMPWEPFRNRRTVHELERMRALWLLRRALPGSHRN